MSETATRAADSAEKLFARWRDHADGRALGALFDRTAPDLFRIALSVAPDAATAEEAVQETFLALIEDSRRCDLSAPLMPWLVGVLRHKVLDARRRERRVPDPLRLEPRILPEDPAEGAARRDAVDRVRAAIDRLPEPYRGVAMLRWEYGLEPGEIAHARGEPPGTVRSTLSRALERLRADLGSVAVLALVLGVRPPEGLAAIRRSVLTRAGVPAAAVGGPVVVAGVAVGKLAASAVLLATLAAGALVGAWAASRSPSPAAPGDAAGARADGPAAEARPAARPRRAAKAGEATDEEPRDVARRAAEPSQAAAPPAAGPARTESEAAVARAVASLDGTWSTAWRVGQDLADLPSQREVLAALRSAWPTIGGGVDRRNLLKGFDYDGASPIRVEVFDLGASDPDPRVQWWALRYLEPYAGRRLVDAPDAWRALRESSRGASPESLLDAAAERLLVALRNTPSAERDDLVALLTEVASRRGAALSSRGAALDAALGWYADPAWMPGAGPLARLVAALQPEADRARAAIRALLAAGTDGECRALVLAGALEARWAWGEIVPRLCAADEDVAVAAAEALADLDDLRAVAPLVEAFDVHPKGRAASAIAAALQALSGVSEWRGRDAVWWRAWWTRHARDVEAAIRREEGR